MSGEGRDLGVGGEVAGGTGGAGAEGGLERKSDTLIKLLDQVNRRIL